MKQRKEKTHGITLIALVITIIILIILVGVTIVSLTGENSLFTRAKQAKLNYSVSSAKEKLELAITNLIVEQTSNGENTNKEDLLKINSDEIDVGSIDNFPVEIICQKYKFLVNENFVVTYIGEADRIIVTYTTNPEGYTNGDSIKILIKVTSSKGIKSIQKPGEIDRLLAQGQKTIGLDYEVTKNGHYIFTIVDLEDNEIQKDIYIDKFDKLEPLEFTPEIKKEGYNITVIENGKDSEETEDSAKSGIDYYKYFLIDSTGKEIEYEINKIEDLDVGNYKLYLIAYDRAGNCKKSNVLEFFISRQYKEISVGYDHSLAIDSEGKLWAGGYNYFGQLGDGTTVDKNNFIQIASDKKFVHISSGDSRSFGIDNEGNTWAWGANSGGYLGIGTYDEKILEPTRVKIETKLNLIKSYGCNLALDIDGSMWAWGYNGNGQYGNGTNISQKDPIQIQ